MTTLAQWERALQNVAVNRDLVLAALQKPAPESFDTECRRALAFLNLQDLDSALAHLGNAARMDSGNRMIAALVGLLKQRRGTAAPNTRVLVVDDSATHTLFVKQTLEQNGYEVRTAGDGTEALTRLEGIDLVLLDITMPGMDGYDVCTKVRENPQTASIPVVLLSGKDGFFDKVRGRMVGANDYLTKPCPPQELLEMVRRFTGAGSQVPADTTS